jgi:hypothetical protein
MDKLTRDDLIRELQKKANEKANELQAVADFVIKTFIGELRSVGTTLNTFKNAVRGAFAQAHTQDYALTLKRTSVCRMTNAQKMTSILKILAFYNQLASRDQLTFDLNKRVIK